MATLEQGVSSGLPVLSRGNDAYWMLGSTHRWCVAAIIWQWLARMRQFSMLVFLVRARRNEFPALFDGKRMIPWHVGESCWWLLESLVLTGETRWLLLVCPGRALQDAHKTRRKCEKGSGHLRSEGTVALCYDGCGAETVQSFVVVETKGSRSTETSRFSAGSMRGETISSATVAWQSLQLAESFWAGTSVGRPSEVSMLTFSRSTVPG